MANDGLDREYESAVADVLAHLVGDAATVERDVRIRGRLSGRLRQIDVTVRGDFFGLADALLVVDCKRHVRKVTVKDAENFIGVVNDVGAEMGFLVTSSGMSQTAADRLESERGVLVDHMPLAELERWKPPGTQTVYYAVALEDLESAQAALRKGGFRTGFDPSHGCEPSEVVITVFRHYPRGESVNLYEPTGRILDEAAVSRRTLGGGVVVSGGTPRTTRLEITRDGLPTNTWLFADDEQGVAKQLGMLRDHFAPSVIDVIRPEGWPLRQRTFGARPGSGD